MIKEELNRNCDQKLTEYCNEIEHLKSVINNLNETISKHDSLSSQQHQIDNDNVLKEQQKLNETIVELEQAQNELRKVQEEMQQVRNEFASSREECEQLKDAMKRMSLLVQQKDHEVNELSERTNHMEVQLGTRESSAQYHESEVQRLEIELSRLREHMVTVEENYVSELVVSGQKSEELENEILQLRSQIINNQTKDEEMRSLRTARDKAMNEISSLEDRLQQHSTSVANLQGVIEQLEKDHQRKLQLKAVENEKRLEAEKQITLGVSKQLKFVEERYRETVQTLEAANRLTHAIESKDAQINQLKSERKLYSFFSCSHTHTFTHPDTYTPGECLSITYRY